MVLASMPKTTVQAVSEGLTCQCGCGLTVANCNHPQCEFSVPIRTRIEAMIGQGMPRSEIIAYFRGKYGEKILSAPTTEGFNLIAWIMPFAALLVGGGLIFVALGRWRTRAPAPTTTTAANDTAYDPELRRQLEREIKEKI
jgi:cytochrome c-type biogenesis protein CcmH